MSIHHRKVNIVAFFSSLCFIACLSGFAHGQEWPTKPVRLIVPSGVGNAVDFMGRLFAELASSRLQKQMFVENLPGASNIIGTTAAAQAPPDGYTFLFATGAGLGSNLVFFKKLPYDPNKDFTAVGMVVDSAPLAIAVNAELPVHTIADLIAYAKANPGKLSYGVDASSGYTIAIGRLLTKRAEILMNEVTYRASSQMVQETASGTLQVMISSPLSTEALVRAGKIRRLAITSKARLPGFEQVPTVSETLPGFVVDGWFAIVAPRNTPAEIVKNMNLIMNEFLKDPAVVQKLLGLGLATSGAGSPASTESFIATEQRRWRELATELNLQPNE